VTLAAFIHEDLRARILGGTLTGKVTLRDLSQGYGVSLTPVREAVQALVRDKVLRKDESGRLAISPSPPRSGRASATPRPQDWHQVIARDLMRRSLRGEADFLREEAMAERHGVGRTVLRHVFSRLAGAGMLEHVPRRGWRVRPFREEDMHAYLEVRELLEVKALDLARPRLDPKVLERILEKDRPSAGVASEVDTELHPYLIETCRNRFIQDFFRRHGAYYTTLFYYAALGASAVSEMARQHREILADLLDRRWDRARAALALHIRDQAPVMKRMMARLAKLPPAEWPEIVPVRTGTP
jgi:DNA-binding GntR family transcriptional regulator